MTTPLLEARGLVRSFGTVQALRQTDFVVYPGEVVGLVGDNGAGKSTLTQALSGNLDVDAGTVLWEGVPVRLDSPMAAKRLGIETVHQDLGMAPDLDAAANLYLGRELTVRGVLGRLGFLDRRTMRKQAAQTYAELGVRLQSHGTPVANLSGGQRQGVAVARSIHWASKVVFMDEPTAALGVVQRANVLDLIRRVRDSGVAVVLISHNMPEVFEVCDRVEVLRLGQRVAQLDCRSHSMDDVIAAMTGAVTKETR